MKTANVFIESFEAAGVGLDEVSVDPAVANQDCSEAVEENQIGFRTRRVVMRRGHGGFGFARIDNNDLGLVRIAQNALPHDRMCGAQVGADENDYVGFLEILVAKMRCVETDTVFVSGGDGGHALARVAVAVNDAHAKFGESTEKGHFFGADLAGADVSDGIGAVLVENRFETQREN